jgi:hypothetical protein
MERLHRLHAGFKIGAAILRALGGMTFASLVVAGIIWVIDQSFTGRTATVLTVCAIVGGLWSMLCSVGKFLGPPEPSVKSSTQLETRRALRRAGMLRRRWFS